ncbi:MAG: ATP-dependent DNA helicase RecG [Candidatus Taylorbacteria bacterium]|nr:ATP-dependent DNA helicase RecG [Candidatus Taylorbacteria bacterium]
MNLMDSKSLLEEYFRLAPPARVALKKLGIKTVLDLLYHFPVRYGDTSEMRSILGLKGGDMAVVFGKITGLKMSKGFRTKIAMAEGWIEDDTGKIKAIWFNQPYIAKMTAEEAFVRVEGKVSVRKKTGELYFSNPKIETVNKVPIGVGDSLFGTKVEDHTLYPIYPESRGVTSNWIYHAVGKIFSATGGSASGGKKERFLDTLDDPIPDDILSKYNLPGIKTALVWIHTPHKQADAMSARKRFAFEEVFLIQLEKQRAKKEWQKNKSFVIEKTKAEIESFTSRFPFSQTEAQKNASETIFNDFKKGHAMSRLLEGDVGSGKTAVAATTVYAVTTSRPKGQTFGALQTAYMCPTEILATQHFESFIKYFSHLPIQIALITGSGCRKFPSKVNPDGWTDISRNQLLKWVANGEIPILIGTHALIQKAVKFKNLAYVIIDEQHRFGTAQRQKLVRKDKIAPHLLSMTATPIPRTLALTVYGDLDLSLLDEMPVGRKSIITEIVLPTKREEIYEKIRVELKSGRQAYVICPRIDLPDPNKEAAVIAKSVNEEAERLQVKIFPEYEIGILHSKMTPDAKDKAMEDFKKRKTKILCATSVVEVGVNVPNATVIVIEGAERFGLAQLHQLRGRVIRSNDQAYCYVFAETKTQKTLDRLKALQTAKNGFELAEYDLKFRGAGELSGNKQWGVSDIAMEALKNLKMVEAARLEAARLISEDETLSDYPLLAEAVKARGSEIHFE